MSKEKQIEEMAKFIDEYTESLSARDIHKADFAERFAEALYNAGYHKQSVGEWVTKGDIFKTHHCSVCNYSVDYPKQKTTYCPECGAKLKGGAE